MIVENAFTVAAPMDDVFDTLRDVRTMLPCLDARVTEVVDGHTARGELTIPMGDHTMVFRGTLRVGEADREAGAITYEVAGRGAGSASARGTLAVRLRESAGTTTVAMQADLDVLDAPLRLGGDGASAAAEGLFARLGDQVTRRVGSRPPTVRGTVRLMAPPVPSPAGGPANLPGAVAMGIRRRPWVVPAALLGAAALAAVVRSRRAAR
ncbi:MAG TPA: SRPBCC family protein [Candidatus Dormibacteraeota bacterium]|nr:SRPBCC family protein [Candidatus Dormibacteraeota bacterium]